MKKRFLRTLLGTAVLTLSLLVGVATENKSYAWEADYAPAEAATAVQSYQDGSQYVNCHIAKDYFGENYHAVSITNPTGGKVYIMDIGSEFCDVVDSGEDYPGLGGTRTEGTVHFFMNGSFYEAYVSVDTQSAWSGSGLPSISFSTPTDRGDGTASVWVHMEAPNGMKEVEIQGGLAGINGAWLKEAPAFYFKLNGQTVLNLEVVVADANPLSVELYDNLDNREVEDTTAHASIVPFYWLSDHFPAHYFDYNNTVAWLRQFVKEKIDGWQVYPTITLDYFWNADGSAKVIDRTQIYGTDWSDANNYSLNPAVKSIFKPFNEDGTPCYLTPAQILAGIEQPANSVIVPSTAETTPIIETAISQPETTVSQPETITAPPQTSKAEQETTPTQEISEQATSTAPIQETTSQPETSVSETTAQTTKAGEAVPETTVEAISGTIPEPTATQPTTSVKETSTPPLTTESLAPNETQETSNALPLIIGVVILVAISCGAFVIMKKNKK